MLLPPRDIFNEVITFYVLTFCFVTLIFASDKASNDSSVTPKMCSNLLRLNKQVHKKMPVNDLHLRTSSE